VELKNKFVYQLLIAASQVMLPLITWPYITRVLGPDNLGKVNYVDFLAQVFMIVAAFGIPFYGVREIAMTRNNTLKRGMLVKELILLQTIFAILASGIFVLLTFKSWGDRPLLYLIGLCNILISSFSYDWYIQGMEHFKFAAIRTVFVRILMLVCFFMLVKVPCDYEAYYGIFSFGMLLIAFMNATKIVKENTFDGRGINLKKHLVPLWHFFLTSSAISLYVNFDTIILHHITHNEEVVGYYTTALKMVKIFLTVIVALSTVLISRMSYLAGEGRKHEIKNSLDKFFQFILVAGLPVCCGLYLLAPEIIQTIAGEKFLSAIPLMQTLSFLPLIIALSNMFCFQVLVPFKQEKKFLLATVIGCIVSVSLNFLLIPSLSAQGAAYASVTTEVVITFLSGIMAYRIIQWRLNKAALVQTIFVTLLFIPVVLLCRKLILSPYIVLAIALPLCAILYFIIQHFVFRNMVIKETKQYMANLLKF
jgi:O-antigen/teichoic acid export membrane protein